MKEIQLSNGGVTLVDDEDFEAASRFNWGRHVIGYAYRPIRKGRVAIGGIYLHRDLLLNPQGTVDHINQNKLDNRRSNLRVVQHFQNLHNRGRPKDNISGFKGVSFDRPRDRWSAAIKVNGTEYKLGRFEDKLDAVRMRNLAEIWFGRITGQPRRSPSGFGNP